MGINNMRELKFRAWDKMNQQIGQQFIKHILAEDGIEFTCIAFKFNRDIATLAQCLFSGNYEVMQYTGLKDKNGKEIYEGDVVKRYENCEAEEVCFGEYDNCESYEDNWSGNGWYSKRKEEIRDFSVYKKTLEVIGNIYENPDLLK